jgi:hypothetical protein
VPYLTCIRKLAPHLETTNRILISVMQCRPTATNCKRRQPGRQTDEPGTSSRRHARPRFQRCRPQRRLNRGTRPRREAIRRRRRRATTRSAAAGSDSSPRRPSSAPPGHQATRRKAWEQSRAGSSHNVAKLWDGSHGGLVAWMDESPNRQTDRQRDRHFEFLQQVPTAPRRDPALLTEGCPSATAPPPPP